MAKDLTKAYRSYLAELERECRQTIGTLAFGILVLSIAHPLLTVLVVPTTLLAAWYIYHDARSYLISVLFRSALLKRALKFEDYDPDLLDSMEMQRLDNYRLDASMRLRTSALETFWRI